jgi:hypothetical protein
MPKIAARDWIFQISDGQPTPTWLDIAEINEFDDDPSANEEVTDGTVFDSDGEYEGRKMQKGRSIELTGFFSKTGAARDPGQARVEAVAELVGIDSLGALRFRHTSDTSWTVWNAIVSCPSRGGGNNAFTGFKAKFTRSGAATTAPVA